MFANQVPLALSILFLVSIFFPVFMIANLVEQSNPKKKKTPILIFYLAYFALTTILCFSGVFSVVSLPPRIIIVTTLPLLVFYLGFTSNTSFYKSFLKGIGIPALVRVHIFRLIGAFFLLLFFVNQLPKIFALIAGLGDLITAISSWWVAKAYQEKKSYAKKLVLFWNTFGFIDILLTSASAIILTKLSIETGSMGVDVLTQFPFCFIPAFAPATIIFLHITIYRKIFFTKYQ